MREFQVTKNDADQRVDRFLQKAVPALPGGLMQKYIRLKRVKVNGKRTDRAYRLAEGDVISLYINDEFFDTPAKKEPFQAITQPQVTICYEDTHILIANKPPGMLSHSADKPEDITLIDHIKAHLYQTGQWNPTEEHSFTPALCNRLDRNTGGLVIAAKTATALKTINEKIKSHEVDKYYILAVHGTPNPPAGVAAGYYAKNSAKNQMHAVPPGTPGAKHAITEYKTLKSTTNRSLVECKLITGRTHQIRVQMATLGHPLLGDKKYGPSGDNFPHQALWAYRITFRFTSNAGALAYLNGKTIQTKDIPFTAEI